MNQSINIAPEINVPSLIGLGSKPFMDGVTLFKPMKMIEDLGRLLPNSQCKQTVRFAIYECPYCGKHFKTRTSSVIIGDTQSCGCAKGYLSALINTKHGLRHTHIYNVWSDMKKRCYNANSWCYKYYGGKGVSVCDEWRNDFMAFYQWAIVNGYSDSLQIDRENGDGNYCPENCRWVTRAENCQNKGLQSGNTSGYKGVWLTASGKYLACITWNNRQYRLGLFDNVINGALSYNQFIIDNHTAHKLNIIKDE